MSTYTDRIIDATGRDDAATIAMIEALMRAEAGDLEALDAGAFDKLAARALDDAEVLHVMGGIDLVAFCQEQTLDVPDWVARTARTA
ncbi:hypothetical protein [Acrocarpospora catenulata]|uniref:hypothetical protein n=1 Tax=Acrocarpospora catenulata TaxID=2836182 RepID=UPI001BDA6AE9|nr:hypothetical protein [Acrocarpospora catenulata]